MQGPLPCPPIWFWSRGRVRVHVVACRQWNHRGRERRAPSRKLQASCTPDAADRVLFVSENPDFQVRFHWEPNSIAIWDNRVSEFSVRRVPPVP